MESLSWGQIDEHCWFNNVGGQELSHLTSYLNGVEMCVVNIIIQNVDFVFCQTFQPNKGQVKIILLPVIALSFPLFFPKLEQALHQQQEQHS